MPLHVLTLTTALHCSAKWQATPPLAVGATGVSFTPIDLAALDQSITDDTQFVTSAPSGFGFGIQAVVAQGTTSSNTITAVTTSGITGAGPPVSQIQVGDLVLGTGIPLGTFVQVIGGGGTAVTISQNVTSAAASQYVSFVRYADTGPTGGGLAPMGLLYIPNRGVLKVLPGDVVAVDSIGFPILVSGASISAGPSQWTFT